MSEQNQTLADEVLAMSELDEKELFSKLGEADFKNRIKNILEADTPAITQRDHLKELLIEFGFYENK